MNTKEQLKKYLLGYNNIAIVAESELGFKVMCSNFVFRALEEANKKGDIMFWGSRKNEEGHNFLVVYPKDINPIDILFSDLLVAW